MCVIFFAVNKRNELLSRVYSRTYYVVTLTRIGCLLVFSHPLVVPVYLSCFPLLCVFISWGKSGHFLLKNFHITDNARLNG